MRELSLFTGAGGGLLGTKLLGFKSVGYVEFDEYCQQVINKRIQDGVLENAPIFSDIKTFISEGFAKQYTGMVDIITGGFPCQGWSSIGKQKGESDERNLWPETMQTIDIVRPSAVFLENSTNVMSKGYILQIIQDLSSLGYVGRASRISGLHSGAHSKRERMWIKAELPDTSSKRLQGRDHCIEKWEAKTRSIQGLGKDKVRMDLPNPRVFGANNRNPRRVDRLRAIGNMQIPSVAKLAWETL